MGNMFSQTMNTNPVIPPPLPNQAVYFLVINGQQQGGYNFQTVANLIQQGQVAADTLAWKNGMPQWARISEIQEFTNLFGGQTMPPPLPIV
jgi:hypothetical protein